MCAWSPFKTLTVEWWSMRLILLIKRRYVTEQRPYRAHTCRTKEALTNLWVRRYCHSVYCLRKSSLYKNDDAEGQKQLPGQKRFDKRHLPLGWNLLRWGISEGLFPLISGSFMLPFPPWLDADSLINFSASLIRYIVDVTATSSGLRLVDLRGGDMVTAGMPITRPVSLVTKTAFMWPWCLISYWQHSGGLINMSVMLCRDCWGSTCLAHSNEERRPA